MELVYRIATETSPLITQIRNNVYVSVTPVADADGRDRAVDWFYQGIDLAKAQPAGRGAASGRSGGAETATATGEARAAGQRAAGASATATAGQAGGQGAGRAGGQGGDQPAAEGGSPESGRGGASGGAVPYWGKYVYHDNNRDINVALVQMRALTDWYYTAHPPIMHDLHESLSLMYTYSGGPPQNPNLDPLLFAELSWFSNWELAQMTKWGMPGVYTIRIHGWLVAGISRLGRVQPQRR